MATAELATEVNVVTLPLSEVRTDGGTQARVGDHRETIREYGDKLASGVTMPPGVVFFDGECYWLADGFQRYHGAQAAGFECYDFEVHPGTRRDAILYAVGANEEHGLKRTPADKRNAILMLLDDEEWRSRTSRWIAEQCRVSHHLVEKVRAEQEIDGPNASPGGDGDETEPPPRTRTGPDGKQYPVHKPARPARPAASHELPADDRQDEEADWNIGEKADDKEAFDELGQALTATNKPAFALVEEFKVLISTLQSAIKRSQRLCVSAAGAYVPETRVVTDLRNAREALKVALPFCNCPQCHGSGCRDCKKSGFITKLVYDQLPSE